MKCAKCGYDFIQRNPELCPSCGGKEIVTEEQLIEIYLQAERYEDAAVLYEELDLLDKAEECRKKANPNYVTPQSPMGKICSVNMECPNCKTVQPITAKKNEVVCTNCSKKYAVPEKAFELL
jgi:DNA-directed RNA polymerase subunit RPC12/RpoP